MLTAEEILAVDDIEVREVAVPEWKGTVFLRVMDGGARDAYDIARNERSKKKRGKADAGIRSMLLAHTLCNAEGVLLFGEEKMAELSKKNGAVLARLFDIACDMNGIGAKAEAQAEKNSDSGQSDDTGSN